MLQGYNQHIPDQIRVCIISSPLFRTAVKSMPVIFLFADKLIIEKGGVL
jgi:hypothetical protein